MISSFKNEEKKRKKQEKKDLKNAHKNVNKSITDIIDLIDREDEFIKADYGYANFYQIRSKDVFSLNEDEIEKHIRDFSNLLRQYQEDLKILCMYFPVNTSVQQENIRKKIEQSKNEMHTYYLNKRLKELVFLEDFRQNKEFYIMIFGNNKKEIVENENLLFRLSSDSVKIDKISYDKKIKILFKLGNQNSKI